MTELKTNEELEQTEKKRSKIPGFRSGKLWKKVVASIGYLFIGLMLIGIFAGGDGGEQTPSQSQQPATVSSAETAAGTSQQEPEVAEDNSKFIKSGMYKVGKDIPAGEYLLFPEGFGYFQVTKDSSGTLDSIITNDNFSGTRYITVSEGQYLEFRNSKMLPEAEAEPQQPQNGKYPEGMYKIGKDIAPGEYKVVSTGGLAYLEVSKNSKGGLESIISNDNFEGEKYITVNEGQYLKLNGCELIE